MDRDVVPGGKGADAGAAAANAADANAAAGDAAAVEVELKYRMSGPGAGERLLAADELAGLTARGPARSAALEDRYVDTPGGELAAAGYAARLRTDATGTVLTLKGLRRLDEGGVVHRRKELEGPAVEGMAASAWPMSPARDAVIAVAGDTPLEEVLRIRQVRHRRDYAGPTAVVGLSVDAVEVLSGGEVVERFAELEIELRSGDEAALEPLADLLGEIEELVPASTSKLERSLQAVRREAGRAAAAADTLAWDEADVPFRERLAAGKTPGVTADDPLAEAGRKVLRFHLARMIAREAGTIEGREAEELKGMRVATRRQRAAWRVFGGAFDQAATEKHRRRLKAVAADLGAARDLDVLIENLEAYRAALGPDEASALEPLVAVWQDRRDTARTVLLGELSSRRYQRWTEAYAVFVLTEAAGVRQPAATEPHHVRDTMGSQIWKAFEVLRAYEPLMRAADVPTLHELRIASKWLRYTLEFVREAMGAETTVLIERVVALQDQLGWLHDADVAAALAREFLAERAGDLNEAETAAIRRYLADRERELVRLRRAAGTPFRAIVGQPYRRMLGRMVASL